MKTIMPPVSKRQTGLTLVELMVSMLVGLFLLAGVLQVFSNSKNTYRVQEARARLQESGRYIVGMLKRELRMADNWGCAETRLNNLKSGAGYVDYLNASVTGTDGTTDTITLRGAIASGNDLVSDMSGTNGDITIAANNNSYSQNDVVIVSDCINGDIFKITSSDPGTSGTLSHASNANSSNNLSKVYTTSATVYKVREVTFSIGTGASGEPALFRTEEGVSEEMVDGVEGMQVKYGIDTDSDYSANRYVDSGSVGTWNNVVSYRISLLLRSADNLAAQNQTYTFNGATVTAGDNRIRQVYTTTVNVRNRQK